MMRFTQKLGGKAVLRIAALATAGLGLSGCVYDVGLGYASDGYGSGYYDCDPYSQFDNYYDCDNGYGFSNIGYSGGWYNDYWYPGYGFYLFDQGGRRHSMRDNDRRYWGERRHSWYRENRGRHQDCGYRSGGRDNHSGNGGYVNPGFRGDEHRRGGEVRDDRGRNERARGDWRHGQQGGGQSQDVREYGRPRIDGNGDGSQRGGRPHGRNRDWQGNSGQGANAVDVPAPVAMPTPRGSEGRGRNGGYRQPQSAPAVDYSPQAAPTRQMPERRGEGQRQRGPRKDIGSIDD